MTTTTTPGTELFDHCLRLHGLEPHSTATVDVWDGDTDELLGTLKLTARDGFTMYPSGYWSGFRAADYAAKVYYGRRVRVSYRMKGGKVAVD